MRRVCALYLCLLVPSLAFAEDPFTLSASGGGADASASGNNLVDLVGNLIDSQDEFAPLSNRSIDGTLRYGALNDAVLFTRNSAGTSATITIPSTGYTKTFNADNEDELSDQIEDFFKNDGADAYADFLNEINRLTAIGVTDGNPLATTAILADLGFYRFGFITPADAENPLRINGGWDISLSGGVAETDDADGYFAALGLAKSWRIGDRVAIAWANNFRYRDVEGAAIYQMGSTIGLPIAIINANGNGLAWHVTPAFVGGFGGSWDLAAGGFLAGGQLTSRLAYHNNGWTIALANQIGFFEGVPIEIDDFRFETNTSQQIAKNGVQLIRDLGDGAYIDVGLAYTSFLDDAFVDDYWSPSAGLGLRFGDSAGLRIGYKGDFADEYTAHGGNVLLYLGY